MTEIRTAGAVPPSAMDRETFVATFGRVFEHSPWIAEAAFERGLPADADSAAGLHRALCAVLRAAPVAKQRALIEAHPDLAGRLSGAARLTADSTQEQAGAGLDRLSDDERARFAALNAAYRGRFGFPFVMAIKGRTKHEVLRAFERRLGNDAALEHSTAVAEIEQIALLRLLDLLPA
jgi:2-oxo-4-hydroxy-4-carboxy-5-ureidoimidazoline decarboxylase